MKRAASPASFLVGAVFLGALFAAAHLMGLREDVAVLSLSPPEGESFGRALAGCVAYLGTYFGVTLAAPVLALASGFWFLGGLVTRRRGAPAPSPTALLPSPTPPPPPPPTPTVPASPAG
jgi:hypothetical protein